jgi:hypothetical protein
MNPTRPISFITKTFIGSLPVTTLPTKALPVVTKRITKARAELDT